MRSHIYTLLLGACLILNSYLPVHGQSHTSPALAAGKKTEKISAEPNAKPEARPFAIAELFSSEGCHSCAPAYGVMQRLSDKAAREGTNLYVLDYHVDYWNDNDWTDPFSKKQFTDRQRRYAQVFPDAGIYTPQLVVNGSSEIVGSDEVRVYRAVKNALNTEAQFGLRVTKTVKMKDSLIVDYALSSVPDNAVVHVALVQDKVEANITAGKNAGRKLVHYCVVREMETQAALSPNSTIGLPLIKGGAGGNFLVIVFLQDPGNMKVLAADAFSLTKIPELH